MRSLHLKGNDMILRNREYITIETSDASRIKKLIGRGFINIYDDMNRKESVVIAEPVKKKFKKRMKKKRSLLSAGARL